MRASKKAYVVGTCDTKYQDLVFVRDLIESSGVETVLVDVGTTPHKYQVDITAATVASFHPSRKDLLTSNQGRGDAVTAISEALTHYLSGLDNIAGVIGLGGSGGTALITRAMRALPVGIPKVMVSTVASGNIEPYVGVTDIMMVYSITDISGINRISHTILSNAAHAVSGMARQGIPEYTADKPALGLTMFGVTTACVNSIQKDLKDSFDCLVFHATGTGGRSMEKLVDSGFIKYIIDVTTTEIADLIAGGVMSAGEDRMGAVIRQKLPYVGSLGAMDMVNFGSIDTVPEQYRSRRLYQHNAQVTLMRTSVEENVKMGLWLAGKLNQMEAEVRLLIPEKGVSMLSVEGQYFYHPEADRALFETLEAEVKQHENRRLVRLPFAINQPEFSSALVAAFKEINNIEL